MIESKAELGILKKVREEHTCKKDWTNLSYVLHANDIAIKYFVSDIQRA